MERADISLQPNEPVSAGFCRVLEGLLRTAVHRIQHPSDVREDDVHFVRVAIKRSRALLRLIKPTLGKARFKREDGFLREAAHRIAAARDLAVTRKVLTRLGKGRQDAPDAQGIEDPDSEPSLAEVAGDLTEAHLRLKSLPICGLSQKEVELGLRRIYRQTRRRMKQACAKATDHAFHRWRIRTKNLFYSLEWLEGLWPGRLQPLLRRLKRLQSQLGDDHDLVIARDAVAKSPGAFPKAAKTRRLLQKRSQRIRRNAQRLGKTLFRSKAEAFLHRLRSE